MAGDDAGWQEDLARSLEPFLGCLSHPARRRLGPLCIAGLIGPGERKSVRSPWRNASEWAATTACPISSRPASGGPNPWKRGSCVEPTGWSAGPTPTS